MPREPLDACKDCAYWQYVGIATHKLTGEPTGLGVCHDPKIVKEPATSFVAAPDCCEEFKEREYA